VAAIDLVTGQFFLGRTVLEAGRLARNRLGDPRRQFHFIRIGFDAVLLRHGGRTSTALIAFVGVAAHVAQSRGGVFPWNGDVERALFDPDSVQPLDPLHSRIAPALTLAASLFPGVAERRVLVWTDGRLEERAGLGRTAVLAMDLRGEGAPYNQTNLSVKICAIRG